MQRQNRGWSQELMDNWGVEPGPLCLCGCGEETNDRGLFPHGVKGHDHRVAMRLLMNLLVGLRGNPRAVEIVRDALRR